VTALSPVKVRLDALDIVRGIAVLGILLMNVISMGAPQAVHSNPTIIGWTWADQAIWWIHYVLASGTMRGLLSLLFGAGFILMTTGKGDGVEVADVFYRRTIWLVIFGIIHGYVLLWPGDILLIYGTAALLLFPWRHWAPARLVKAGAVVLLVIAMIACARYYNRWQLKHEALAARASQAAGATLSPAEAEALKRWEGRENAWKPNAEAIKKQTDARLGGYASNWRVLYDWANELNEPPEFFYWTLDALAMMFVGAALVKWRVIQGGRTAHFYLLLALCGYGFGMPMRIAEAWPVWVAQFKIPLVWAPITMQLSRAAVTLGHLGLILLLAGTGFGRRLLHPFAAVGRLALSNYIAQTLLCQWLIFPGFGLGYFGKLSWTGLWTVVFVVNGVLMIASVIYIRVYQTGPLESLLRRLSYRS
jgi:uncharacterized protein